MALDYTQPIDIKIETEKIDLHTLPENIRSTHRFLLKFISIAPYSVDVNCTVRLHYKNLYDDTEFGLNYVLDKDQTWMKQKLPVGIVAREWRLEIEGEGLTAAEFGGLEVLWIPIRVGDR